MDVKLYLRLHEVTGLNKDQEWCLRVGPLKGLVTGKLWSIKFGCSVKK